MGEFISDRVEELQEEGSETLTELEYHLLSHPDYDRDETLYVDIPPVDRKPGEAENLIEESLDKTVRFYGKVEGMKEDLDGSFRRAQATLQQLESRATELVTRATKITDKNDYGHWAMRKSAIYNFNLDTAEINYNPKRDQNEQQIH